ncbi:MAG: argininosuccinate lyase [Ignavibacteriaceae bacterium]|nr:argininosuccinate lyase [Ignavibacteriaceae bacterium]
MLWGGRFKEKLNSKALKFSSSLKYDINLLSEDIEGSIAQAEMLATVNIISNDEKDKIVFGLKKIEDEWNNNTWSPDPDNYEDVHSAIESRLFELIGDAAGKLHTGRSRNDQIATDLALWVRKNSSLISELLSTFQKTLLEISSGNTETLIPGYTHFQRAQPISLAFHLLAYIEMLERDKSRFEFVGQSVNQSPLGSGAMAGSTLPLDRNLTSKKLGFTEPTGNALDSVSNRDFILDFLNACSIGMMHLSRFSEELVIWSTSEWNFIKLSDSFTTGSSLMPQKKNPDMAELIRGKTGRVYGNYIAFISTMKSLPLSYNRDLQEDKEPLFDSFATYSDSLEIINGMLLSAEFNKSRFIEELKGDFSLATDLADWIVQKQVPFREAHKIVGNLVQKLESEGRNFKSVTLSDLKSISSVFDETAMECLQMETALRRKKTYGSPNPAIVKNRIEFWKKKLS